MNWPNKASNERTAQIRWRKLGLLAVVGLVGAAITFVSLRPREPLYQGKRVGEWIADLGSNRESMAPAHRALVKFGEPAIPHLIRAVAQKRSKVHSWYLKFWTSRKVPEFVRRRLPSPISHTQLARVNSILVLSKMGAKA